MVSFVKKCMDILKDYFIGQLYLKNLHKNLILIKEFTYSFLIVIKNITKNINFKSLQELESEFKTKMDKINLDNMKFFFGLQCISGVENENDYSLNQYNYSEITQLPNY